MPGVGMASGAAPAGRSSTASEVNSCGGCVCKIAGDVPLDADRGGVEVACTSALSEAVLPSATLTGGERELRPVRSPTPSRKSRPIFCERICDAVGEATADGVGLTTAEAVEEVADAADESAAAINGGPAAGTCAALAASVVPAGVPGGTARNVAVLELDTLPCPAAAEALGAAVDAADMGVMVANPLPDPLSPRCKLLA